MGSASDDLRQAYIDRKGPEGWEESRRAVAEFWNNLEEGILALELDYDRVRLYQDGLAVCGQETEIVRDLAGRGGPNYRILIALMARGAALEGTENPELLLKEYRLLKAGMWGPGARTAQEPTGASVLAGEALLEERDRYIARRIDATLRPGETGMLFLGALHRAVERLPSTIEPVSLRELMSAKTGKKP